LAGVLKERVMSVETVQSEQGVANTQNFDNQAALEKNANLAEQLKQGAPDAMKQIGIPTGGGRQESAMDYVGVDAVASGSKYTMAIKSAATVWDQSRSPGGGIKGDLGRSRQSRFYPSNGLSDDMKQINSQRRENNKRDKRIAGNDDILARVNISGQSLTDSPAVGMSVPGKLVTALSMAANYIGTVVKKIYNNIQTAMENINNPSLQSLVERLGRGHDDAERVAARLTPDQQRQMEVGKGLDFLVQQANQTNDHSIDSKTGGFKNAPNSPNSPNAPSAPTPPGQSK